MKTTHSTDIETMRELLAKSDADNFDLAELHHLFLNGFKGYNQMSDDEVVECFNTVFDENN